MARMNAQKASELVSERLAKVMEEQAKIAKDTLDAIEEGADPEIAVRIAEAASKNIPSVANYDNATTNYIGGTRPNTLDRPSAESHTPPTALPSPDDYFTGGVRLKLTDKGIAATNNLVFTIGPYLHWPEVRLRSEGGYIDAPLQWVEPLTVIFQWCYPPEVNR